jgi:hypothetical protein
MSSKENLLLSALDYAKYGWSVFPCKVGLKKPACTNGFNDATTDPEQIRKWWKDEPFNIGIATGASDLVVVDIDLVAGEPVGEINFKAMSDYEPLPETLTVTTRSGGKQFYFKKTDPIIKSSNSQLCSKVDIKAQGAYVIAPPSYVIEDEKACAGYYSFDNWVEPLPLPAWLESNILELQKNTRPKIANVGIIPQKHTDFPCNETNKEKLRQAIRNMLQKNTLSSETDWVQILFSFRSLKFMAGWTDEKAWELFDEICQWDGMGKYKKLENRNRWDKDDFKSDGKTYKTLLDALSKHGMEPELFSLALENRSALKSKRFKLLSITDVLNQTDTRWLVKGLLPGKGLGAIYGASNSGKSFLVIDLLMSLCQGENWFALKVPEPRPVVYLALEGGGGIKNRLKAYLKHHEIPAPANFHLIIDAFDIRNQAPNLLETIIDINPAMVCIDTLNQSAPGSDENSNADMTDIISQAQKISTAINGLVLLVHHTGKDASKGLRGHSSLNAALDIAIEVQSETVKSPKLFRVTKSKDGSCDISGTFKLKVVELGIDSDGDKITSCIVERDTSKVFEKQPSGKNQIAAWDLLKNQVPITYSQAKTKFQNWLMQENPNRKRPDNTAKDAIDGLQQQGFFTLKDNYLVRV